jgi:hypothetical protein
MGARIAIPAAALATAIGVIIMKIGRAFLPSSI